MRSDQIEIGVVDLKAVRIRRVLSTARTLDTAVGVAFDDGAYGYPSQKGIDLLLDEGVAAAMEGL